MRNNSRAGRTHVQKTQARTREAKLCIMYPELVRIVDVSRMGWLRRVWHVFGIVRALRKRRKGMGG